MRCPGRAGTRSGFHPDRGHGVNNHITGRAPPSPSTQESPVQAAGIHHLELTLLFLVLLVSGLTTLAHRFLVPYPIFLFLGGVVLSLMPGLPHISLNPDVIFLVVLPPLLYIGGFNTSWPDFQHNIVSILLLAFGLVG